MEARNEILELSVRFALDIIAFTDVLEIKKKYVNCKSTAEVRHFNRSKCS